MKNNNVSEDKLPAILKEDGIEKPSEFFSHRLMQAIVQQQKEKAAAVFKPVNWIGKFILGILLSFNLLLLYYLNPLREQSVLFIAIAAFLAGTWGVIAVMKRFRVSS
ncbi:hypothetical protein [Chitinophaga sp. ARDCPP14]|uniref:hypothetical protein n=1 Tax=Chitinophaga sp. ARDCPP14 TaxID=3391139 RepID=UPI003F521692